MEKIFEIKHLELISSIVGPNDKNLKVIRQYYDIKLILSAEQIYSNASKEINLILIDLFNMITKLAQTNIIFNERDIIYIIKLLEEKEDKTIIFDFYLNRKQLLVNERGRPIFPKTINQVKYLEYISNYDLVFGIGPAGTGKTYLAVAYAVMLYKTNKIKKIILTRPVVEAGESLGFLPGDIKEKIDPYLIPLYDALYEFLGKKIVEDLISKNVIEIAPLAYMRGRTLDNAFIILDEAQNTTKMQMKMFLTRLGFNSKMVITGDITQVDLKYSKDSGLKDAVSLLRELKDISILKFERIDVVRNPLVQKILERYEDES
ncbi:PhoH family protein [Haploplasma modicum]|uniref:PhoH family protein n=1 Tax=Haploplasma modicum TaxID=2150 RepID=UPI00214B6AD3|nr:PhoH family protein [Haploplasma modicum]MCR1809025.1 PhoH family protein [Haploplasma modicum]